VSQNAITLTLGGAEIVQRFNHLKELLGVSDGSGSDGDVMRDALRLLEYVAEQHQSGAQFFLARTTGESAAITIEEITPFSIDKHTGECKKGNE
jgi:hypothetical protein